MSANWIKWCKGLAEKREVRVLASRFKRDRHEIAGRLMSLWEWCDENIDDSDFVGDDAIVSLCDRDSVVDLVDGSTGIAGMLTALECPEVDWISVAPDGKTTFKNLARHNGKTAKERAAEQRKKAKQREKEPKKPKRKQAKPVPDGSAEPVPEVVPVTAGPDERRREETRGQSSQSSKGEWKTIGSASAERGDTLSTARSRSSRSPNDVFDGQDSPVDDLQPEPFDLSLVDWDHAVQMAVAAGRKIPPMSAEDRRAWLKYGVLADVRFSENWMADATEAVIRSSGTRKTPQAHFVAVLQGIAAEKFGVSEAELKGWMKRIEIPSSVWKMRVLEVRKK